MENPQEVPSPTLRGMDEPEVMASLQASMDAMLLRLHGSTEESVRSIVHERVGQLFPGALGESELDAIVAAKPASGPA